MQSVKDIKARIKSVSETAQITKAMELISASKMQRASVKYNDSQAYFNNVRQIIGEIARTVDFDEEELHPYLQNNREGKKAFLIIGSDKGLSGDYNHSIESFAEKVTAGEEDCNFICLGDIIYRRFAAKGAVKVTDAAEMLETARIIATNIAEDYKSGKTREVHVVYTHLLTKSKQECADLKLLPILKEDFATGKSGESVTKFDFEPDPKTAFAVIVPQYILGVLYGCIVESRYAEHLERMRAMSSATSSAMELLDQLNLSYNKARQEKITTELTELSVSLLKTE